MDSITQFSLGATLGAALLGPRIGMRNAVIVGGVLGTLPDLDTFLPSPDPVTAFTSHRGASHSLIIQALVTPLFAEPLVRICRSLRDRRIATYAAVYLIFATHALIDAMTVYGTRLFWPVYEDPVGVGSIFIIDPIYTLPLLAVMLWGLLLNPGGARYRRWLSGALVVSTLYMAGTAGLQQIAAQRAQDWLAARNIDPDRTLSIPTPFNTLYWRTIVIDGPRYLNLYAPIAGGDVMAYAHPRHPELEGCVAPIQAFRDLTAFTKGFYRMEEDGGRIIFSDLRMGLTPNYVFRFQLGEMRGGIPYPVSPPVRDNVERQADGDLEWLFDGMTIDQSVRGTEAAGFLPPGERLLAARPELPPRCAS